MKPQKRLGGDPEKTKNTWCIGERLPVFSAQESTDSVLLKALQDFLHDFILQLIGLFR